MTQLPENRPLVWGHRGAMAFAPQNTLPSFQLAKDQGADGVELDVQLTRDGVLVVFHDARVDALTDGRGPIGSLTWNEVKSLDAGSHFGREWAGTRIPTLEEVLDTLGPDFRVNIELKTALSEETVWDRLVTLVRGPRSVSDRQARRAREESAPLAEAVAKVLAGRNLDRYLLSSFDPFALDAAAKEIPGALRGFLHAPSVPWDTPALMASRPYQAWHPHHTQVTAGAMAREKAAGRVVNVWTVNEPAIAVNLAQLGADGVITNKPEEILKVLA